jgi:hypothetical protein
MAAGLGVWVWGLVLALWGLVMGLFARRERYDRLAEIEAGAWEK